MMSLTARGLLGSVAVFTLLSASACSDSENGDEAERSESELVRFPSGIFPNAMRIAYGQTLPSIPFKASALFAAVRFRATQGDRITGTVDAGGKKAIVYLVRKQGSAYINVKAGGQGSDTTSHVVSHTIEATDDYYLVFRTVPRTDTPFAVTLESGAANQACADAGQPLSLNDLVASVPAGAAARHAGPRLVAQIERRECTYATGCGPVTATYSRELPHLVYSLQAYGNQKWRVIEGTELPNRPAPSSDRVSFTQGKIAGTLAGLGIGVPSIEVRGTAGPTCTSLEESRFKDRDNGASYTEYRVIKNAMVEPLENFAHPAPSPLPKVPVIDAMPDEEALRRFPRGSSMLAFDKILLENGRPDGFLRACAPLTSCSALQRGGNACQLLGFDIAVTKAEVTGRDAYRFSTSLGFIDIVDGEGNAMVKRRQVTLRVNESTMQFEFAPMQSAADANGATQEFSNSTCTFPFSWVGR